MDKSSDEVISSIVGIYDRFNIPPNLRMHMFRVASVGKLICNKWKGKSIDKEDIVAALLLHDLGNIVKFDLESVGGINFLDEQERKRIDFWRGIKVSVKEKYGETDHIATIGMAKELELDKKLMYLLEEMGHAEDFKYDLSKSDNFNLKILVYSDVRVGPRGVISMKERFEDLFKRYQPPRVDLFRKLYSICDDVEKQLFANLSIRPEEINDETVNPFVAQFNRKS